MQLTLFIQSLITQGQVSVSGKLEPFDEADIEAAKKILHQYYTEDVLELAGTPPEYDEAAAVWAACYLHQAVQLTMLRAANESEVLQLLQPYDGQITAAAVYAADLTLRYIPSLFELVKGLAPADILVQQLAHIASQWPLSAAGIKVNGFQNRDIVLSSPALRQLYIDRIIFAKDKNSIDTPGMQDCLFETTGTHLQFFWPGYEPLENNA